MIFIRYIRPNIAESPPHHYLGSRGIIPESQPPLPKKPFKKYDRPVYVPAEVYKLLSPEAVAALKKYNSEAINKIAKKHSSLKTLTHHWMIFIRYIRPNIAESPPHHYLGSRVIIPESQPPLHPRSLLRNMIDLYMYLLRFTSSSVLRQLLP